LGDIPFFAKRVPKQHGAQIHPDDLQNCWRRREKYPAECSKTMKLKEFRYPAGYCLSGKACILLSKKRKLLLFCASDSWWKSKKASSSTPNHASGRASFFVAEIG